MKRFREMFFWVSTAGPLTDEPTAVKKARRSQPGDPRPAPCLGAGPEEILAVTKPEVSLPEFWSAPRATP